MTTTKQPLSLEEAENKVAELCALRKQLKKQMKTDKSDELKEEFNKTDKQYKLLYNALYYHIKLKADPEKISRIRYLQRERRREISKNTPPKPRKTPVVVHINLENRVILP